MTSIQVHNQHTDSICYSLFHEAGNALKSLLAQPDEQWKRSLKLAGQLKLQQRQQQELKTRSWP